MAQAAGACHGSGLGGDLQRVIAAWPGLPDTVKRSILDTVKSYVQSPDPERRRAAVLGSLRAAHSDDRYGDRTTCDNWGQQIGCSLTRIRKSSKSSE